MEERAIATTSRQLAVSCARVCDDKKAQDILILDLRKVTYFADYFVICSTTNERQSHAIAEEIAVSLKKKGVRSVSGTAPEKDGVWVLQDFGDVVVHIFREDARAFYELESRWEDAKQVKWQRARAPRRVAANKAAE